jgi:dihydroorotate dehydrogenase (NAD+) catalytic subunit
MDWSSFSIGNAAGFIKGPGDMFDGILRSAATDITIGSITMEHREGNLGNVYDFDDDTGTSTNALGMPNPGLEETLKFAPEAAERAGRANKKLWWSIAGFNPEEYARLMEALSPFGGTEFNLGCPNVWGSTGQKPIASFNPPLIQEILHTCDFRGKTQRPRVKLSPYSDPSMLVSVAKVLRDNRGLISAVVNCNTFANGVAMKKDGQTRSLETKNGYGGVAGNAIHNIALGQVSQFYEELENTGIEIVGVGGIDSGKRLLSMGAVGARGVQIGTPYGEQGNGIFSRVIEESLGFED